MVIALKDRFGCRDLHGAQALPAVFENKFLDKSRKPSKNTVSLRHGNPPPYKTISLGSKLIFFDTVSALYRRIEGFVNTHRRAAKSLAFSLGFEGLDRYFGERFEPLMAATITQKCGVTPSRLFLRFLRHGLIGLGLCMLRGEKLSDDIEGELLHLFSIAPPQNQSNSAN
jgi:hypothetical protein